MSKSAMGRRIARVIPALRIVAPNLPRIKPAIANMQQREQTIRLVRIAVPRLKMRMVHPIADKKPSAVALMKIT
jgi:hypothetical protein